MGQLAPLPCSVHPQQHLLRTTKDAIVQRLRTPLERLRLQVCSGRGSAIQWPAAWRGNRYKNSTRSQKWAPDHHSPARYHCRCGQRWERDVWTHHLDARAQTVRRRPHACGDQRTGLICVSGALGPTRTIVGQQATDLDFLNDYSPPHTHTSFHFHSSKVCLHRARERRGTRAAVDRIRADQLLQRIQRRRGSAQIVDE